MNSIIDVKNQAKAWRRTLLASGVAGVLALGALATNASTPRGPGVAVTTSASVDQTVSQLKKLVARNGMMVMSELNQGNILSMTGIQVQSETLFVGNPTIGKKLFSADPGAGVVVPIRINVYQDAQGQTVVRYIPPSEELDRFHNASLRRVGRMLDKKLKALTSMLGQ